jgi:hypothetical protein
LYTLTEAALSATANTATLRRPPRPVEVAGSVKAGTGIDRRRPQKNIVFLIKNQLLIA